MSSQYSGVLRRAEQEVIDDPAVLREIGRAFGTYLSMMAREPDIATVREHAEELARVAEVVFGEVESKAGGRLAGAQSLDEVPPRVWHGRN